MTIVELALTLARALAVVYVWLLLVGAVALVWRSPAPRRSLRSGSRKLIVAAGYVLAVVAAVTNGDGATWMPYAVAFVTTGTICGIAYGGAAQRVFRDPSTSSADEPAPAGVVKREEIWA